MTWEDVRETVDSQIEVVQAAGEDSSVLYERGRAQGTGKSLPLAARLHHGLPGYRVLIETKWRANSQAPFAGRTLPQLLERLDIEAKLLVIVNALPSDISVAQQAVADVLGARGRVVGWRDVRDDSHLGAALTALLDGQGEPA
jgi:hypothetical protein